MAAKILFFVLALELEMKRELMNRPVSVERWMLHFHERLRRIVATRRQYGRVARSIKDIPPHPPPMIPEMSIKEINPLLLFAGCRAEMSARAKREE